MDVGDSLNPALDIGQVEGAFMQGLGLFTIEELCYSPTGSLLTKGPGAYKIPGKQTKFNVINKITFENIIYLQTDVLLKVSISQKNKDF